MSGANAAILPETASHRLGLRGSRGPVLLSMMLATAIVAMDSSILSTIVPTLVQDLGGFSSYPWLFSIYLLTMSVTVPVYSKLADTIGRKPIMLIGIGVFLVASILAGFAWDMPSLIVFRALQGIGAGAIQPMSMTVLGDIYTVEERAKIQGYLASMWAASSVVGPLLGALFASIGFWRGVFFINIPIAVAAGWLVWANYHETLEPRKHRIDVAGAVLVTAGLGLVTLGILEGGNAWAWDSPVSIGVFVVGALLLAAFVLVERRAAEPIIPLGTFRSRIIVVASVLGLAQGATVIGLTAFIPTYLEIGSGVSAFIGGAAVAVVLLGWPTGATLSGRVYLDRGYRFSTILGTSLVLGGGVALAIIAPWPAWWAVAICCLVMGLGFGFSAVPALVAAQSSVVWQERGVVTGVVMFTRSLGQALGAAVLGAVSNGVIAAHGGNENDPATMIGASAAVFAGVAIIALLHFGISLAMPRTRRVAGEPVEATIEGASLLGDEPDEGRATA